MDEGVVADEVGGLGAFAAAGAAEEEDDGDVGGGESWLLFGGHFVFGFVVVGLGVV